jgi:hypothetical protein
MPYYPSKSQAIVEAVERLIEDVRCALTDPVTPGLIDRREAAALLSQLGALHWETVVHEACERAADHYRRHHALPRDHGYELRRLADLEARREAALAASVAAAPARPGAGQAAD